MSRQIEILDERGNALDLTGRIIASAMSDPQKGIALVQLNPVPPISPEVDETWTKADVRHLIKLLKKRERLLEKMEDLIQEEHSLEFDIHDSLQILVDGREL